MKFLDEIFRVRTYTADILEEEEAFAIHRDHAVLEKKNILLGWNKKKKKNNLFFTISFDNIYDLGQVE